MITVPKSLRIIRRIALLTIAAAVLAFQFSCQRLGFFVKDVFIDEQLVLHPAGIVPIPNPVRALFYYFSRGTNLITAEQFSKQNKTEPRQRTLYLEMDYQYRLSRMVQLELLSTGSYGALYSERECFFNKGAQAHTNHISIVNDSLAIGHEQPKVLNRLPLGAPRLMSFSLVRVYVNTDGSTVVAAAIYDDLGSIMSLYVGTARAGQPTSGKDFFRIDDKQDQHLVQHGIPAKIDIPLYITTRRMRLPPISRTEILCVTYRH